MREVHESSPTEAIVVLVALGDAEAAREMARAVVEAGLAACAQRMPIESCYRWEGETVVEDEQLLLLKTGRAAYAELERFILARHAYAVPEILALRVKAGLPAYLAWLEASLRLG